MTVKARRPTRKAKPTTNGRQGHAESLQSLSVRLQQKLGRSVYRSILETIDRETTPLIREPGPDAARTANSARLATLRAQVFERALSSDEVRRLVGRSRPTINKMAKDGLLLAVPDGRSLRFPRWQFDGRTADGIVAGLHRVLAVMDASAFRKAAWFISENPALDGQTPVAVLRNGDLRRVMQEARTLVSS